MKIGLGFDAHGFDPTRSLVLGGVTIPDAPGLAGHSDGDAVCHALADALLGGAAVGDLGDLFPPTDTWRDASSLGILVETAAAVAAAGWELAGADVTVIAQRPRLKPHRREMQERMAAALSVSSSVLSVKATTTDGLGFTGRGEGIAAIAVVLLQPTSSAPVSAER